MHAYATLAMLAFAGSALAAPAPHWGKPHIVYETEVVTIVVGPDGKPINDNAAPTPTPKQPRPAPAEPTPIFVKPTPEPQPEPQPEPEPKPAPQPKPVPQPAPVSPPSTGSDYMATVNAWRQKLGKATFQHDSTLEANAVKTCKDGNGEMKHELNPGTFGQVLAPGDCKPSEFERIFVGGWLCERPNMPGMDGVCNQLSKGWAYGGQTGHADILTGNYKKVGCGCVKGIWACDVA